MRFIPAVSGVQVSVPPPSEISAHRKVCFFFCKTVGFAKGALKKEIKNFKKVLTDAPSACIIVQVANGNGKRKSEFPSII